MQEIFDVVVVGGGSVVAGRLSEDQDVSVCVTVTRMLALRDPTMIAKTGLTTRRLQS